MRKRTSLILIVAAGMAGAAVFGFTTIRRGFRARDNSLSIRGLLQFSKEAGSCHFPSESLHDPIIASPQVRILLG